MSSPIYIPNTHVLIHLGVQGMRWGKRTSRGGTPPSDRDPISSRPRTSKKNGGGLSDRQKMAFGEPGGAATAGVVVGAVMLAKRGDIPLSQLNKPISRGQSAFASLGMDQRPATEAVRTDRKYSNADSSMDPQTVDTVDGLLQQMNDPNYNWD